MSQPVSKLWTAVLAVERGIERTNQYTERCHRLQTDLYHGLRESLEAMERRLQAIEEWAATE